MGSRRTIGGSASEESELVKPMAVADEQGQDDEWVLPDSSVACLGGGASRPPRCDTVFPGWSTELGQRLLQARLEKVERVLEGGERPLFLVARGAGGLEVRPCRPSAARNGNDQLNNEPSVFVGLAAVDTDATVPFEHGGPNGFREFRLSLHSNARCSRRQAASSRTTCIEHHEQPLVAPQLMHA